MEKSMENIKEDVPKKDFDFCKIAELKSTLSNLEVGELEILKSFMSDLLDKKHRTVQDLDEYKAQMIEKAKEDAKKKAEDIKDGKRLEHWVCKTSSLKDSVTNSSTPVLSFTLDNVGYQDEKHQVFVGKKFNYVWLKFPYDDDMIITIRGKKDKRGNIDRSEAIEGATWTGYWRIPFDKFSELIDKVEKEYKPCIYQYWKEVCTYVSHLHAEIKKATADAGVIETVNSVML